MEEKKKVYQKWWFWVCIMLLIIIAIIVLSVLFKPKFEVKNFTITSNTTDYEYIENYTSYSGKGSITTKNKNATYLIVLKAILKSGDGKDSKLEYTQPVLVSNGTGEFTTYNSEDEGYIKAPEYEFEIISYIKFNNI